VEEAEFRATVYMAAVCRCFPGKAPAGGDRVPNPQEIENCSGWLAREIELLQPELVLPVGKLAIAQFLPVMGKLDTLIGSVHRITKAGATFDLVPLPHPSGASPWHRMEPGKSLLGKALRIVAEHPAWEGRVTR
jgi:uracil-DNA glycosylase